MTGLQELYKASKNLHCLASRTSSHSRWLDSPRIYAHRAIVVEAIIKQHLTGERFSSRVACWQRPGNTHWWAKLDLYKKMTDGLKDLVLFCMISEDDWDIERSVRDIRLVDVIKSHKQIGLLRFELAILTIAGGHLNSATYNLEGDNCCSLVPYDTIKDCANWLTSTTTCRIQV